MHLPSERRSRSPRFAAALLIPLSLAFLPGCPPSAPPLPTDTFLLVQRTQPGAAADEIVRIPLDGSAAVNLSQSPGQDRQPAWSAALRKIAFVTDRDGQFDIYRMDEDGSNPVRLTSDPAQDMTPAWSPDGQNIVFATDRDGDFELFRMNDSGHSEGRLLDNDCNDSEPAWSPDGAWIVYASDCGGAEWQIWIVEANGSNPRSLHGRTGHDETDPAWSPDGTSIVFESHKLSDGTRGIFRIDADGGNLRPVLNFSPGSSSVEPAWSPDGDQLAIVDFDNGQNLDIFRVTTQGSARRNLTSASTDERSPVWAR